MVNTLSFKSKVIPWSVALGVAIVCTAGCVPTEGKQTRQRAKLAESDFVEVKSPSLFQSLREQAQSPLKAEKPAEQLAIAGRVLHANGQPAVGAALECWTRNWKHQQVLIAQAISDSEGSYKLDVSQLRVIAADIEDGKADKRSEKPWDAYGGLDFWSSELQLNPNNIPVDIVAVSIDECVGWHQPQILFSLSQIPCDVKLQDNKGSACGIVVASNDKVLAGVKVELAAFLLPLPNRQLQPGGRQMDAHRWATVTDEQGRFAFRNLPSQCVAMLNARQGTWPVTSWEMVQTSAFQSQPLPDVKASPCKLFLDVGLTKELFGKVIDWQGTPVEGIVLKVGDQQVTTNAMGEYKMSVYEGASAIQVICPENSQYFLETAWIDRKASFAGQPQPPIELYERVWVEGRVVSKTDRRPVPEVFAQAKGWWYLGTTGKEGEFKIQIAPTTETIDFVPGWLTRAERELYSEQKRCFADVTWLQQRVGMELRDVTIDDQESRPELQVRVLLPGGEPAVNCAVRLWVTKKHKARGPKPRAVQQTLRTNAGHSTKAVTDETGLCRLAPFFAYSGVERITVAYPEIDPRYFGEMTVAPQQEVAELRLKAARPIRGKVTYNGSPMASAYFRAEPIAPNNAPFEVLRFDGISDARGNYEVYVPEWNEFAIRLLTGVLFFDKLIGNDPIPVAYNGGETILGPTCSIESGRGQISGVVVGNNNLTFSGAHVLLKLPPGKIIHGVVERESGPRGEFTIRGLPDGKFDLIASPSISTPQYPVDPKSISTAVPASTGDANVRLKLPRNGRSLGLGGFKP